MAAGFDTRAYRLAQPGVTFFEVDLPSASQRKQKLVSKLGMVGAASVSLSRTQNICSPIPVGVQAPPNNYALSQQGRKPVYVAADLSREDLTTVLQSTGFDASKPTLFTIEGLIYYLPEAAAHRLVESIGSLSAPGSMLFFDFLNAEALQGKGKEFYGFMTTAKSVANKVGKDLGAQRSMEPVT